MDENLFILQKIDSIILAASPTVSLKMSKLSKMVPLQTNFHVALETSQRVVKETADRDKMQITAVLDGLQQILEVLNNSYDIMQNFSLLAKRYKTPNIVTGNIIQVSLSFNWSKIGWNLNWAKNMKSLQAS